MASNHEANIRLTNANKHVIELDPYSREDVGRLSSENNNSVAESPPCDLFYDRSSQQGWCVDVLNYNNRH